MSRRIEIELTSRRDDGTWTWRAAGAKQPKGSLDGALLHEGATVGDVVRADADFTLDGIEILSVLPPKTRSGKPPAETIELLGGTFEPGVRTHLAPKRGGRDRGDRGRGRDRGGRRDRGERGRGGERGERGRGGERDERGRGGERGRGQGRERRRPPREEKPRPKKLRPGREHRKAWLSSLPEDHRIVAEQLSRGGLAAVRREIDVQNEKAKADGSPEVKASALIALAEKLLPDLRIAEWRDRADAALASVDEIDLRDLRTVVVAGVDAAKDSDAMRVLDQLRESLTRRVEQAHADWLTEISSLLGESRVVRALRVASRPPKAGSPLPPDLAQRLANAANEALTGDVTQHRLATVLDAVSRSPVRPKVVFDNVPDKPGDELLEMVRKVASSLPQVAEKFGVSPTARPKRKRKRPRSGSKIPPKPKAAPVASAEASSAAATAGTAPTPTETGDTAPDKPAETPTPTEPADTPPATENPPETNTSGETAATTETTDTAPTPTEPTDTAPAAENPPETNASGEPEAPGPVSSDEGDPGDQPPPAPTPGDSPDTDTDPTSPASDTP